MKERREREKERRERDEKEQWLRKDQAEKGQRMERERREEFERARMEEIGFTGQAAQMDTDATAIGDGFWEQLQNLMGRMEEDVEGTLHGAEPDNTALPSLLSMLNDRKVCSIRSAEYTLLIEEPVARIFHHVCCKRYHCRPYVQAII